MDNIQLTENYRLASDGKYNLILLEKYAKRVGRGKHAELSGEYDYQEVGYYGNIQHVANGLIRKEVLKYEGSELEGVVNRIEELSKEIYDNLSKVDWKVRNEEE